MTKALQPDTVLADRFKLVQPLGSGAVGVVWHARDAYLEQEDVAVKILNESFSQDAQAVADLKREVLLTRRLRHPNIVSIHTFWDTGDYRFITMEYVKGGNLSEIMRARGNPYTVDEAMPWMKQLCEALHHAHEQEVLHRDIKPGNILVGVKGQVRLADFGIARTAQEARDRISGQVTSGTILFMSPEQLQGAPLDRRSDVYSLGATFYELLRGHPPFYQGSILNQIQHHGAPPIPKCSAALNRVILRALSKRPDCRQPDCLTLLHELMECGSGAPVNDHGMDMADAAVTTASPSNEDTVQLLPAKVVTGRRLGDLLVEAGVIDEDQLRDALAAQRKGQERIGTTLVRLGMADEELIANALSDQMAIPRASFEARTLDMTLAASLPEAYCVAHHCLPIRRLPAHIIVAMADPMDFATLNDLEQVLGAPVEPRVATVSGIQQTISKVFQSALPAK